MVALAIAGLMLAVAVPASVRFYDSMQARQAVRTATSMLQAARERALSSGRATDVLVRPSNRSIRVGEKEYRVPQSIAMTVHGAAELNYEDTGVIRFYPEGGSSGGGIDLRRKNGSGVAVNVDWLVGRVTQEKLAGP